MRNAERVGSAAAVVEIGRQHLELEIDERLEQARLDMRALAGPAAPHQRREHALNDRAAREQIGDGEAERHRPLIAVAVEPHDAGARLREQVLARQHRPRALLAVAGDRGVDDARVDRSCALS